VPVATLGAGAACLLGIAADISFFIHKSQEEPASFPIWFVTGMDVPAVWKKWKQEISGFQQTAAAIGNGVVSAGKGGYNAVASIFSPSASRWEIVIVGSGHYEGTSPHDADVLASDIAAKLQDGLVTKPVSADLAYDPNRFLIKLDSSKPRVDICSMHHPKSAVAERLSMWRATSGVNYMGVFMVYGCNVGSDDQAVWQQLRQLCKGRVLLLVSGYSALLQGEVSKDARIKAQLLARTEYIEELLKLLKHLQSSQIFIKDDEVRQSKLPTKRCCCDPYPS
jgi:hypothetical protein